jgi:integrase
MECDCQIRVVGRMPSGDLVPRAGHGLHRHQTSGSCPRGTHHPAVKTRKGEYRPWSDRRRVRRKIFASRRHSVNGSYQRSPSRTARSGTRPTWRTKSITACKPSGKGAAWRIAGHHRLRDTFAVRKLLGGFQLDDVSRLLGHSSVKVTETYYAKWVASRKRRLERLVAESLVNS